MQTAFEKNSRNSHQIENERQANLKVDFKIYGFNMANETLNKKFKTSLYPKPWIKIEITVSHTWMNSYTASAELCSQEGRDLISQNLCSSKMNKISQFYHTLPNMADGICMAII